MRGRDAARYFWAATAIAYWAFAGLVAYGTYQRSTAAGKIRQTPPYPRIVQMNEARWRLGRAEGMLSYGTLLTMPTFPYPGLAERDLRKAVEIVGDMGDVDDRLTNVCNGLPDMDPEHSLMVYRGKPVDNSTFAAQRAVIGRAEQEVSKQRDALMRTVHIPEELTAGKARGTSNLKLGAGGIGGVVILCVGANGVSALNKRKRRRAEEREA